MSATISPSSVEASALGVYYPASTTRREGPIVAATDRSEASTPALRAAKILNDSLHVGLKVIAVVEPLPIIIPEPGSLLQPLVITPELKATVRRQATEQMQKVEPDSSKYSVEVEEGKPAREIARTARDHDASIVILGLHRHSLFDRLIDGETAIEMLRESDVPVLLASKDFAALPRRTVIAVDFSPESMEAARAAMHLLDPKSEIHLAHVRPAVTIFDGSGLWEEEYERVAADQLGKFKQTLAAPRTMRVETTILTGKPAQALTEFANKKDADLIVSGTHGIGMMRRIFIGSVATGLLHKTEISLLVVPTSNRGRSVDSDVPEIVNAKGAND